MLYIKKGPCPKEIQDRIDQITGTTKWKHMSEVPGKSESSTLRESFNKLNKRLLRESLISEQHGLCAYCMKKIVNNGNITTIEHWYPLSRSKSRALSYSNFFAVCKGGQNVPVEGKKRIVCCDAKKSNTLIRVNPTDQELIDHLMYHENGQIDITNDYQTAKDREEVRKDLDETLRLNGVLDSHGSMRDDTTTQIVKGRRDIYRDWEDYLYEVSEAGELTPEWVEEQIAELTGPGQWDEFLGVKLYLLRQYV